MKSFDEEWETIHSTTEWGQYPSENVIRFVARNFYSKKRDDVKILDFGCGGGAHTWYLSREGFDTYAFDGSASAIEKVKRKLERENLSADLRVLDACELNYEKVFFDAVIDNVCIYANRIDSIEYMYRETYEMLKSGGKLFSSVFGIDTTGYGTGECIEKNTYRNVTEGNLAGRGVVHFFDEDEIEVILKKCNFVNIIIEPMTYIDKGNKVTLYNICADK